LRIAALAALVLLITGCDPQPRSDDFFPDGVALYFEPIGSGHRGALRDSVEIAFHDEEAWGVYRDSLRPVAPFRPVDFDQAIVVLVALPQETSGHSIEIVSVEEVDSVTVVEYFVHAPDDDCLMGVAEAVPFQAVLVRRTELPVTFKRTMEYYRCTFGPRR
jgi:hypothetical protein